MREFEKEIQALLMQRTAKEAQSKILRELVTLEKPTSWYIYRTRIKKDTQLIQKAAEKNADPAREEPYALKDITDNLGLRIVTLFRSDLLDALSGFLNFVSQNPALFDGDTPIEEAIIYISSDQQQALAEMFASGITTSGLLRAGVKTTIPPAKDSRYSSIHLIVRSNFGESRLDNWKLPIEVQIRTSLEDTWAEIDHLRYDMERGKENVDPITVQGMEFSNQLKVLKGYLDAALEHADIIGQQMKSKLNSTVGEPANRSVSDLERVREHFSRIGVPDEYSEVFFAAVESRRSPEGSKHERMAIYANAAKNFEGIVKKLSSEFPSNISKDGTEWQSQLHYIVTLEYAFCLLSTDDPANKNAAIKIYEELENSNAAVEDPVVPFRLGISYTKTNRRREGVAKLEEAIQLLEAVRGQDDSNNRIRILNLDAVAYFARKYLGTQYWWQWSDSHDESTDGTNQNQPIQIVIRALDAALEARSYLGIGGADTWADLEKEHFDIWNNIICYAAELAIATKNSEEQSKKWQAIVREELDSTNYARDLGSIENLRILDSLRLAFQTVGQTDQALVCAKRVMKLLALQPADQPIAVREETTEAKRIVRQKALELLDQSGMFE